MNFVGSLDDIRNKLFKRNRFSGCYVYSRDQYDTTFKLGMSEANLFDRVKQAKACFPYRSEFWIHMFIVCHDKTKVRPLEKKLLAESRHLKKVEVEKEDIKKKEQGIRPVEFRIAATRSNLNMAVCNVLNENLGLWDLVVVFGENGWVVHSSKTPLKSSMLDPSSGKTKKSIEPGQPLKVGDKAYVVYKKTEAGTPIISKKGKIVQKLKLNWKVLWENYDGEPYTGTYPFNEVYKLKKEADYGKKYWYEL
jgi:hypothetical protein